jgi:uncharacterized membrane protein
MARVETKLQAVVGFGATGAAFLAAGDLGGVPIYGLVVLILAAMVGLFGLRPTRQRVVPEPARLRDQYSSAIQKPNPEEILLAALVPTKVDAFAITRKGDARKVATFQVALVVLVAGVLVAIVTLLWWDSGRLAEDPRPPAAEAGG